MFKPKCINGEKIIGHSATGWILPCCWLDPNEDPIEDEKIKALFTDDLKIENVESIEDILYSDPWIEFMNTIQSGKDVPTMCLKYCSESPNVRSITRVKNNV